MDVIRCIQHVAQIEAPIYLDALMARTASFFGIQRVGSQVRARLEAGVRRLASAGRISLRGDFVWLPAQSPEAPPLRGPTVSGQTRSIEEIPLEEVRQYAQLIRSSRSDISFDALCVAVARGFGFDRTGRNIQQRVAEATAHHGSSLQGQPT